MSSKSKLQSFFKDNQKKQKTDGKPAEKQEQLAAQDPKAPSVEQPKAAPASKAKHDQQYESSDEEEKVIHID